MASNGHSFNNNAPDLLPLKMEVDLVDSSVPRNSYSDGEGNNDGFNGEQDNVDIVIPPATSSLQALQQEQNTGSRQGDGSELDSKGLFSLLKRFTPSSSKSTPIAPIASSNFNDVAYHMEHNYRGRCVIFNHCKFDVSQQLNERSGSDCDVQNIKSAFTKFGFTVSVHTDLKFAKILELLNAIAREDHSQNDCLAVFVLTHGISNNEVHAFDIPYKVSTLWDIFTADKCSTLAGKPKMFFIQACRGFAYDDGTQLYSRTEVDGPGYEQSYRIPNQADFLTVFSTFEAAKDKGFLTHALHYMSLSAGYYSWRNSKNGSCFIQALCKVFLQWFQYKDILSMLTMVNHEVAMNYESRSKDPSQNRKKQVPHVCHTLMREIYLLPKHRSTLV